MTKDQIDAALRVGVDGINAIKQVGAAIRGLDPRLREIAAHLNAINDNVIAIAQEAEMAREILGSFNFGQPEKPDSWGDAMVAAENLPPEGGVIDLPDGTRIEVRPTGEAEG